jgi:hypothetical protein
MLSLALTKSRVPGVGDQLAFEATGVVEVEFLQAVAAANRSGLAAAAGYSVRSAPALRTDSTPGS